MNYELYMGTYYLMEEKRIIHGCDEVAIAFTKEQDGTYILMKHGDPELVKKWVNRTREVYTDLGVPYSPYSDGYIPDLYMITGKFPVEDLNRIIDTSGWIKYFLEKHNISLEDKIIKGKLE
jgi:hypothetical protein